MKKVRCAIYTRKSSDEGLDQSFNSLDAQHEACSAYIASQRHEGWRAKPTRYDDAGLSGGTLERPALQNLLGDIDRGQIDMVVVYKIDRLTRSLADFAKLVDRMEATKCSFVSVAQSFNTSSSMGCLTLNVLLSFAQFEREVTAERIRDKIAASKRKGLWMGGLPPLGYDPHLDKTRRELVVNDTEAETVRRLFVLYLEAGCLNACANQAVAEGIRSKRRTFRSGRTQGGTRLSRGQIHAILTNPVYRGLTRHKDKTWPGKHPAIIEKPLWDQVQATLATASGRRRGQPNLAHSGALLVGKFTDQNGARLTPTHTQRHGRRYRYYVSHGLVSGVSHAGSWRLPAQAFERAVVECVTSHLMEHAEQHRLVCGAASDMQRASQRLIETLPEATPQDVADIVREGEVQPGSLSVTLDQSVLADWLGSNPEAFEDDILTIKAPFTTRQRGIETKIITGHRTDAVDPALLNALRKAHRWCNAVLAGTSITQIAHEAECSAGYVRRLLPLATLSPKVQHAIATGTQPTALTLERLTRGQIPLRWCEQEDLLLP